VAAGHHHPHSAATPAPPTQKKKQRHSVLSFTNHERGKINVALGGKIRRPLDTEDRITTNYHAGNNLSRAAHWP